ncbi:MAG: (d)CMP kinase [Buchnera aphidicola (Kaburagia rhusicola ensigallis)]
MKQCISVITIDGPSGSGKSKLCKKIAEKLNWNVLESGLIYRFLAVMVSNEKYNKKDLIFLSRSLNFFNIINNKNFKNKIRKSNILNQIDTEIIGNLASKLAGISYIRKCLLFQQRLFHQFPGLVADGRDMGTVIFPSACLKFFLKADLNVRVQRRLQYLKQKGIKTDFNKLFFMMKQRDYRDHNRTISPLVPEKNAIIIDSTDMSLQQVVNVCMKYIKNVKDININTKL